MVYYDENKLYYDMSQLSRYDIASLTVFFVKSFFAFTDCNVKMPLTWSSIFVWKGTERFIMRKSCSHFQIHREICRTF